MCNALTNFDIQRYANRVKLPHFRGVFMRDTLPQAGVRGPCECGIVNLNTSQQPGSHWVCYYIKNDQQQRVYFDSFGQITPIEIQKYLKTKREFDKGDEVIQRNTDIVQSISSCECGHLCLIVLTALSKNIPFQQILNVLRQRHNDGRS